MLTGQATKRLPKSKVTSSREPPAPARACAGQRRRDTRGGGTVGDQQGQEGASRRLRRRSRRTTAPKDGPGHPTLACDDGPSARHSSRHSAPRKPSRGLTLQLSLTSSSSGPLSSSSSSSLRRWEQQRRFSPRVSEVAQKTAAKPQLEEMLLLQVSDPITLAAAVMSAVTNVASQAYLRFSRCSKARRKGGSRACIP